MGSGGRAAFAGGFVKEEPWRGEGSPLLWDPARLGVLPGAERQPDGERLRLRPVFWCWSSPCRAQEQKGPHTKTLSTPLSPPRFAQGGTPRSGPCRPDGSRSSKPRTGLATAASWSRGRSLARQDWALGGRKKRGASSGERMMTPAGSGKLLLGWSGGSGPRFGWPARIQRLCKSRARFARLPRPAGRHAALGLPDAYRCRNAGRGLWQGPDAGKGLLPALPCVRAAPEAPVPHGGRQAQQVLPAGVWGCVLRGGGTAVCAAAGLPPCPLPLHSPLRPPPAQCTASTADFGAPRKTAAWP